MTTPETRPEAATAEPDKMTDSGASREDATSARPAASAEADPLPQPGSRRLQGRIALVTGGGTGIGRAIAELFAREGASVVVSGRRAEPLQEVVHQMRRDGGIATFARGDVTKSDRVEMLVQAAVYNFGGLDIVVNNAGVRVAGTILETDERRWERAVTTNLKGPYLVSRMAIPALRARGGGAIINIASMAALTGTRGAAAYAAAKGGLVALTRSMAVDFAADRIRVNAICPGAVDAPSSRDALPEAGAAKPSEPTRLSEPTRPPEPARLPPLGRSGTPDDVARLALFLASEESGWMTGAVIPVDGGLPAF